MIDDIFKLTAQIKDFRMTHVELLSDTARTHLTNEIIEQFNKIALEPLLTYSEVKTIIRDNLKCQMSSILYSVLREEEVQNKLKDHYRKLLLKSIKELK